MVHPFPAMNRWAIIISPYGTGLLLNTSGLSEKAPLFKGENDIPPSRINLRDSNPVRGEMFIETGTTKHISSSVGATCEIAARNTYRTYGACWLSWSSYAINMSLLTELVL